MDVLARISRKSAVNCDNQSDTQNSENHQDLECILHFWVIPESMPASVSISSCWNTYDVCFQRDHTICSSHSALQYVLASDVCISLCCVLSDGTPWHLCYQLLSNRNQRSCTLVFICAHRSALHWASSVHVSVTRHEVR